ncbi:exosome non-catalytic core subunit rrp46 [Scheffersomyces spartinae]|uniref:Exosome non-catalytic core subunit rrp46 n=1 Tax=Scheffersomyces spartinae TaxID=45513 RepID=A0A9P7VDC9_9ASCO|nr:exosome non-catalytic core subunit rrp46 [Scheffersomyces spartinae]KAG7195794.1 exosome non-catalytic core subunit rrp46 [Scheffersomyces spartinae]
MSSLEVHAGVLGNSDGSCLYVVNGNKVITSVVGPIEAKARQELPQTVSLEVVVRPVTGLSNSREKLLEEKIRNLLQNIIIGFKYPRQTIQVVVQFLIADGRPEYTALELNMAINSAFYALVDAGVAMYKSFVSTVVAVPPEQGSSLIFDPSMEQIVASKSHHVVTYSVEHDECKIILLESNGLFEMKELKNILDAAKIQCLTVHEDVQRDVIESKLQQDYIWKS